MPRTDEVLSTLQAHRFVSVLGAAWPLMGQTNVAETGTFTATFPRRGRAETRQPNRHLVSASR